MKKTIKMMAVAGALALVGALAACDTGSMSGEPGGQGGEASGGGGANGPVSIGIKFDQPGLGLQVGSGYEGFDVEVAKYVANELGYGPVTFVEAPSPQRENLIIGGQVKMIFATYSITDARKEKISFAGPYFVAGQDLLVAQDSTITGPQDLEGKKLCSVTGSTPAEKIAKEYPGVQLQNFDTYSKCVEALASGSLDAVTTDDVILAGFAAQEQFKGKLKVVGQPFSEERYGVGIAKGDTELCGQINEAIGKMIESGAWKEALDKTVGPSGYVAPEPPSQDACS